jgi:aminoglycoside phosphotransferase family enzyme
MNAIGNGVRPPARVQAIGSAYSNENTDHGQEKHTKTNAESEACRAVRFVLTRAMKRKVEIRTKRKAKDANRRKHPDLVTPVRLQWG